MTGTEGTDSIASYPHLSSYVACRSSYLDRSYEFSSEELEFEVLLIYLPTLKNGKTKDCWDVPGGKREIGETTFTAGIRETEEEAGIRLTGGIEGLRKRGIARNGEVFWEVYL